jgi:hypothetical protein
VITKAVRLILSDLVVALSSCTAEASAQIPAMTPPPLAEWPGVEIVEGVAFQGDGSVTVSEGPGGIPVISFWRPILFREETDKPIAARMDCKVVAADGAFSKDAFDPAALHEAIAETRAAQGYVDFDRRSDERDHVRRLDVVSLRKDRRERAVLSYILVRDGERLVDIRRNCTFIYRGGISRPDVIPFLDRYTRVSFAFEPNDGSPPRQDR